MTNTGGEPRSSTGTPFRWDKQGEKRRRNKYTCVMKRVTIFWNKLNRSHGWIPSLLDGLRSRLDTFWLGYLSQTQIIEHIARDFTWSCLTCVIQVIQYIIYCFSLTLKTLHLWNQNKGLQTFEISKCRLVPCCNTYQTVQRLFVNMEWDQNAYFRVKMLRSLVQERKYMWKCRRWKG